jgi:uncharacterized Zn finger protein
MTLVFPAEPHRRVLRKIRTWWGRAFWTAVEELADDDNQIVQARSLARSGRIGGLVVDAGRVAAGVAEEAGIWTVALTVPPWDADERAAFLEVVTGRTAAILAGRLSDELAEHAEEAGLEIVPGSDLLAVTCSCPNWQRMSRTGRVCEHALGVLVQVADLIDQDPLVLLHLRGIARDDLSAHDPATIVAHHEDREPAVDELELAVEAAVRAAQLLEDADAGPETEPPGHDAAPEAQ